MFFVDSFCSIHMSAGICDGVQFRELSLSGSCTYDTTTILSRTTASPPTRNDRLVSETPPSPEDVGHEDEEAQDEEHDPNPEPEETPLFQIPAPSIEPENKIGATTIRATKLSRTRRQ